jgi:LPS export ABC transporter protein LptC
MATAAAVAFVLVGCSRKLREADRINLKETPFQVVDDMFAVQTKNGKVVMRIEADKMARFETDTATFETFPLGLAVYAYTDEGLLETVIISDDARHEIDKTRRKGEYWSAFGNVIIHNVINQETMETDTIYWDQVKNEIWTDCYVKMYSPDGMMQGYGMRSDDHARNAILHNPFNSFGYAVQDSTQVIIDSVNFIGPFPKK